MSDPRRNIKCAPSTTLKIKAVNGTLPRNPTIIGKLIKGLNILKVIPIKGGDSYNLITNDKVIIKKLLKVNKLEDGTEVSIVRHPILNEHRGIIHARRI